MPGLDELRAVALVAERVGQGVDVRSGDAEDPVHPPRPQACRDELTNAGHVDLPQLGAEDRGTG